MQKQSNYSFNCTEVVTEQTLFASKKSLPFVLIPHATFVQICNTLYTMCPIGLNVCTHEHTLKHIYLEK